MGGTGRISSLKAVIERLERRLNTVVGGLWDVGQLLAVWRRPLRELSWMVRLFEPS